MVVVGEGDRTVGLVVGDADAVVGVKGGLEGAFVVEAGVGASGGHELGDAGLGGEARGEGVEGLGPLGVIGGDGVGLGHHASVAGGESAERVCLRLGAGEAPVDLDRLDNRSPVVVGGGGLLADREIGDDGAGHRGDADGDGDDEFPPAPGARAYGAVGWRGLAHRRFPSGTVDGGWPVVDPGTVAT